jgi:hypothetical protein
MSGPPPLEAVGVGALLAKQLRASAQRPEAFSQETFRVLLRLEEGQRTQNLLLLGIWANTSKRPGRTSEETKAMRASLDALIMPEIGALLPPEQV